MNLMNKFINKLQKFLNGRYGPDELYSFLLVLCLVIILINAFFRNNVLTLIELIIFFFAIFGFLSKDISKRRGENKKYLNIKYKVESYFNYRKNRFRDRNTHMYKKCPKCRQKIRLPLKKGNHTVKCPNCKEKFDVRCKKNEKIKIEIVK